MRADANIVETEVRGVPLKLVGYTRALELCARMNRELMADRLRFEGGYHKSPAHQDWRSVQGSLDGLTLWLPLYDVGPDDYPLEVVRGSHRQGLLNSVGDAFGHRVADAQVPPDAAFEAVPMRRGDVAAFSGFLVHRTGQSGGALARIALSYRFNNLAEPSYVRWLYPNPYSYRGDMSLLGFTPGPAEVASVFGPEGGHD